MKIPDPTIVFVDDDREVLSALQRAFRNEPCEVLATEDPFEALRWIKDRPVDAVVADEFMPAMLGTDLLQAARSYAPKSALIVLTGYPQTTVASRARAQGVDLVLAKPWEDEALRTSVLRLLRARR